MLVAHVGFVIIAAGTTIYWAQGLQRRVRGAHRADGDDSAERRDASRSNASRYRIEPIATKSGIVYQPIDYVSHVTVTGNDGVAARRDRSA